MLSVGGSQSLSLTCIGRKSLTRSEVIDWTLRKDKNNVLEKMYISPMLYFELMQFTVSNTVSK